MSYQITKQVRIYNEDSEWDYIFTNDEYGTVEVAYTEGLRTRPTETKILRIPKDCILHFITALEEMQ